MKLDHAPPSGVCVRIQPRTYHASENAHFASDAHTAIAIASFIIFYFASFMQHIIPQRGADVGRKHFP